MLCINMRSVLSFVVYDYPRSVVSYFVSVVLYDYMRSFLSYAVYDYLRSVVLCCERLSKKCCFML